MQAIILAAGKGTRMRPLTYDIPKPMLPLRGRPILEYTIGILPEAITEIIVVINYLGEHIRNHFGDVYNSRKIRYVLQKELNGTGGAVHSCRNYIEDKFLVLMGDDVYHKDDIAEIVKHDLAALSFEVEDPTRFGIFKLDSENNLVDIIEKPKSTKDRLANIGVYSLNKKFFDYKLVPISETEFGLPQTLAVMARNHPVKVLKSKLWHPIGYPEDLKLAEKKLDQFRNQ